MFFVTCAALPTSQQTHAKILVRRDVKFEIVDTHAELPTVQQAQTFFDAMRGLKLQKTHIGFEACECLQRHFDFGVLGKTLYREFAMKRRKWHSGSYTLLNKVKQGVYMCVCVCEGWRTYKFKNIY